MKNLFWDSSAIVKLLHPEQYSSFFTELFEITSYRHFASDISKVEVSSAIMRKFRENLEKLKKDELHQLLEQQSKKTDLIPKTLYSWIFRISKSLSFILVDTEVIREAERLVIASEVRSLDAIILATVNIQLSFDPNTAFVSADQRQLDVAKSLGIKTLEPK